MATIDKRYDFALLFDVKNGDPETGHGLVSDVCIKRKIRNYIMLAKGAAEGEPTPGFDIYVKERAVLNHQHQRAYDALGLDESKKGGEKVNAARDWMCQTFFDIRMFGAVMTTGVNCGQVRGPVQFAFARSVDPIVALEQSITRMAVTTEREAEKQAEKQEGAGRTMGRKQIVPYALYEAHGFISPHLAKDTGFSEDDLALLWEALEMMFEHDHSAARGEMATRKLIVFEHESTLGNAPSHKLFDRISVKRNDEEKPTREFGDYTVTVDESDMPSGVALDVKL